MKNENLEDIITNGPTLRNSLINLGRYLFDHVEKREDMWHWKGGSEVELEIEKNIALIESSNKQGMDFDLHDFLKTVQSRIDLKFLMLNIDGLMQDHGRLNKNEAVLKLMNYIKGHSFNQIRIEGSVAASC